MKQFFTEKRIKAEEEEATDDGCLHDGIVGWLFYSDLA